MTMEDETKIDVARANKELEEYFGVPENREKAWALLAKMNARNSPPTTKQSVEDILIEFLPDLKLSEKNYARLIAAFGAHASTATNELTEELKRLRVLVHDKLPGDCIKGQDEVKYCSIRQEEGDECKKCSNLI